jgi:hypothetical protein
LTSRLVAETRARYQAPEMTPFGSSLEGFALPREQNSHSGILLLRKGGRRPTLPGACAPSTIGAGGLNFSVRNGKRCIPVAMTAQIVEVGGRIEARRTFKAP